MFLCSSAPPPSKRILLSKVAFSRLLATISGREPNIVLSLDDCMSMAVLEAMTDGETNNIFNVQLRGRQS